MTRRWPCIVVAGGCCGQGRDDHRWPI